MLLLAAVAIGLSSLYYTNSLINKLAEEEKKKVELWATGTKQLANLSDDTGDISILFEVIKNNKTVPVILTDEDETIHHIRVSGDIESCHRDIYQKLNVTNPIKKTHHQVGRRV